MMICAVLIVVKLCLFLFVSNTYGYFTLEFESLKNGPNYEDRITRRDSASGGMSCSMNKHDSATLHFCLPEPTRITVKNVLYSNDGMPDTISVFLSGAPLGTFSTIGGANWGQNWDLFRSTGHIGVYRVLPAGLNKITFVVTSADDDGVEMDAVWVDAEFTEGGRRITKEDFFCIARESMAMALNPGKLALADEPPPTPPKRPVHTTPLTSGHNKGNDGTGVLNTTLPSELKGQGRETQVVTKEQLNMINHHKEPHQDESIRPASVRKGGDEWDIVFKMSELRSRNATTDTRAFQNNTFRPKFISMPLWKLLPVEP